MKRTGIVFAALGRCEVRAEVFKKWKSINTDLPDCSQLVARQSHDVWSFTPLGCGHEQIVCVPKRYKRNIDLNTRMLGFKGLDGLKEDVFFSALSSKGVPHGQRNRSVVQFASAILSTPQAAGQQQGCHNQGGQAGTLEPGLVNANGHD